MTVRRSLLPWLAALALLALSGGPVAGTEPLAGLWDSEILVSAHGAPALGATPAEAARTFAARPDTPEAPLPHPTPPAIRLLIHRFNE